MGSGFSTGRRSAKITKPDRRRDGIPASAESQTHHKNVHPVQNPDHSDAIAIVGIGCRTPGADNIHEFWRLLQNGECHVTDVPAHRWNSKAFLDPDPAARDKAYVQKGGFIKDVEGFDNVLFNINDYEASQMDPQQCLLLECTSMALEDAGFTRKKIAGTNTAVYIGCMNSDYATKVMGKTSRADGYTSTGSSTTILASRLSFTYNLQGPCMVLDTACSASLVAIHQGCLAIQGGDSDMAVCGGVNCMLSPDMFIQLSKARMISPTGLCRTFSDKADGYTRGEGCGIVILKRLRDAIRDGDKVWATICTGTNQDGRTVTPITAPSGEQQKKLLQFVHDKFKVDVNEIGYIEAHGTGTPAGDPVETNSLGAFYTKQGQPRDRFIGSVKTNIGHTEGAAGVLGLIKVLLMMKYNTMVPSLHCEVVSPKIDLAGSRFVIPTKTFALKDPLMAAACNSFGFGGSNAHAVVRSFPVQDSRDSASSRKRCIVCFSGNTQKALRGSLDDFYAHDETPFLNVYDVSYTSTVRRDHHSYRATFIVKDMEELMSAVKDRLSQNQWGSPVPSQLNIVFVFCGMGTAWEGMCRQLLEEYQIFRETLLEIERLLLAYVPWSLTKRLQKEDVSKDAILAPIAIFAYQVGLANVWHSLGIRPSCVLGQSIGELAAAYFSGCLSLADAVKIVYHRSQLLAEVTGGAMVVVRNVQVEKVKQALNGMEDKASIALEYSPKSCAVSADSETMSSLRPKLLSHLRTSHRDIRMIDLDVCVAYHSPHVNKVAEKLKEKIKGIMPRAPSNTQLLSTVTGQPVASPPHIEHWANNVKKPVLFHQAMTDSVSDKTDSNTIFLEIGPKPVLLAHMNDLFPNRKYKAVPSVTMQSEMKGFYQSVATLYEHGADIDWKNLPTHGSKITPVPRYSFDKKHIKETSEQEILRNNGCNMYRKNHLCVYLTEEAPASFRLLVSPLNIPSVYQHVVMGKIVIPGALYAECGFALAKYIHKHTHVSVAVDFQQLLPFKREESFCIEIVPVKLPGDADSAEKQFVVQKTDVQLATLRLREIAPKQKQVFNLDIVRSRCPEEVSKVKMYSALQKFGFEYGTAFSLLEHAHRNPLECLARLQLNDIVLSEMAETVIHPCILDCMLQCTILTVGGVKTSAKQLLPKSIAGLSIVDSVKTVMYVHARLKSQSASSVIFEMKLLSTDGHTIAEITDFTVQALVSEESEPLPDMLAVHWDKIKDISQNGVPNTSKESRNQEQGRNLLLLSEKEFRGVGDNISHVKYDSSKQDSSLKKDLETFFATKTVSALVLQIPQIDDNIQAEEIQSRLINTCILIQTIFLTLNDLDLRVPVYVCTVNAWPSTFDKHSRDVSPFATALWGLLRTVVAENVYYNLVAVELHTSSDQFTGPALQKLLHVLMTDSDIAGYPEVLITDEAIYVNQVSHVNSSIVLPKSRVNPSGSIKDASSNALVLSKELSNFSQLQVTGQKPCPPSEDQTVIKPIAFAKPSEKLLDTRVSASHVLSEESASDYIVMALEVSGHASGGSGQELTSCCLAPVGPAVAVPKDTTLKTALLPDYQIGDLSKLTLFWSLVAKVPTRQFTILASRDTMRFAELVKLLSCNHSERKDDDVNIACIESISDGTVYHATVLSLILIDVDVMSMIAKHWNNAHSLVSFSYLVTSNLQAFMSCVLSKVQFCTLDTQLIFQPYELKKTIPSIKEWIENHSDLMSLVAKCIHSSDTGKKQGGIHELLYLHCLKTEGMSVQIVDKSLFQKDGAYLVVGGLTGLGWMCVEFLAQNNAGYIAIINRRAPSPEQRENMEILSHQHDCKIKAFQADISSRKSLEGVLKLLSDEWSQKGRLKGIFTGAAVLQDGFFPSMDRSAFEKVLSPKVQGTWNLHQLTKDLPLDYFVMHSSVASVLGNLGQANYSTGNAFLDGVAYHRRHLGLAAQTINWGPLDIGLLDKEDTIKHKLDAMGFKVSSKQDIREALVVLMMLNWPQSIPVSLNQELYTQRIQNSTIVSMINRFQKLLTAPHQEKSGTLNSLENVHNIRFMESGQRLQLYEVFVREVISRILNVDMASVSSETNLFTLGLDSVTGMMMVSVIERNTSFRLSAIEVLSGVTVASLVKVLNDCAKQSEEKL